MIPFYRVKYSDADLPLTPESRLSIQMGLPPWEVQAIPSSRSARDLIGGRRNGLVGVIFDPEFYYSPECWRLWVNALLEDGADGEINVPLGNQDPLWREGLDIPMYLTLRGIEKASEFKGPTRWITRTTIKPESFCMVVVPVSLLQSLTDDPALGDLPGYWAGKESKVRIFCRGWSHSFKALGEAGARHDLISMVQWTGHVLELGCGAGLMAKTCKELNPGLFWTGIDMNRESLCRAKPFLDEAIEADANLPLPLSPEMKFDRIVCADVLEHLPYPCHILSELRRRIKPEGLLIASVPNIGHWSAVDDILAGRWDEIPSGVFCVTHLRFGTKKTWNRWLEETGWRVTTWKPEKISLPDNWVIAPEILEHKYDKSSLETLRYCLTARPAKGSRINKFTF
ncbi:MAG: class I SAM-dependent methyltransferase [Desulfobacterales bacterium]|nr:class I SAM-dependent methyltransferase [Desulfobacterales bacterium]